MHASVKISVILLGGISDALSSMPFFFWPPVDVKVQLQSTLGSSSLLLMAEFTCLCDTKKYAKPYV